MWMMTFTMEIQLVIVMTVIMILNAKIVRKKRVSMI